MWLNNNLELVLEEQKKDFYFLGLPRYWVNKTLVHQKIKSTLAAKFNLHNGKNCNPKNEHLKWLICWRDICRSTDERSVISSIIPIGAVGHTLSLIWFHKKYSAQDQVLLVANLNSIIIDYIARQKLGGMHLSFYHLEQFPIIEIYRYTDSIKNYIVSRVLELVYTAEAMRPWAEEIGYFGEPFVYDDEYRSILKAELDAIYGRIYQLTKEELHFILDPKSYYDAEYPSLTFPKLKNNEIKKYGEYRTMRLVLEAWDRQEQEPELWQ